MTGGAAFRGQPLLLFGGLLAGWLATRVVLWEPPFEALRAAAGKIAIASTAAPKSPRVWPAQSEGQRIPETTDPLAEVSASAGKIFDAPRDAERGNLLLAAALFPTQAAPASRVAPQVRPPVWPGIPAAAPAPVRAASSAPLRWSGDGWLLLRHDAASQLVPGRPAYGRSQAGAVVRYSLAPATARRPQVYVRTSTALTGPRERELAAGFSARPVPGLPVRVAGEMRASETDRTRLRPAAYAVTEILPQALPFGARGDVYLQAGYVGGEFATVFVDGQARAVRPLVSAAGAEVEVGAGAWGGAQEGSARLDIGPTVAISFPLGGVYGRVAADYRFRIAGDAEPSSGPALTVSAGF